MKAIYRFRIIICMCLFLMLCSFGVINVTVRQIEGTIYDESKKPLADVEVINTTNNFVSVSDSKGHFRVKGKAGDRLKFVFPGKPTKEIRTKVVKNLAVYFDDRAKLEAEAAKRQRALAKRGSKIISAYKNPYKSSVIGQVFDGSALPIPGVRISVKGKPLATQTDMDGLYGIDAKIGDRLVVQFIGMKTVEKKITHRVTNIVMHEDGAALSEVVVTSMGIKKEKKALGYATETIAADKSITIRGSAAKDDTPKADTKSNRIKAGQLTAGEINDFSKWTYWEDLTQKEMAQWQQHWQMAPRFRFSVVLTGSEGFGMPNKKVHLMANGHKIWTSRTDNTGKAELWYNPGDINLEGISATLQIVDELGTLVSGAPKPTSEGINTFRYAETCSNLPKVNIAFAVDATGSMGDEIQYLQSELSDVIARAKEALPGTALRMGSVFYRDSGDDYVVKNFDFDSHIPNVLSFLQKQNAGGGGDYPEAFVEACESAVNGLDWDDDARAKLLFVVLDAPPHHNPENVMKLQDLARKASEKGIQIIPIAASGIDKSTEYLMRALALQTNGRYLFITDDSGIGNAHIAPSTDNYQVEMLNDLILRVILECTAVSDCNAQTAVTNDRIEKQLATAGVGLRCFPNPSSGPVTVVVDSQADALMVFDTAGKLILQQQQKTTQYEFDLTGLPNGIYYLKVSAGGQVLYGKIVKKT